MKIVFTGGQTAGHVMVNRILIPYIRSRDPECQILYIGSQNGMEREMMKGFLDVPFYGIHTGKLRRYFSTDNVRDVFRVWQGFWEALKILRRERPQLIYASGGCVTVPVVWAAGVLKIPVFLRETDYSVGLANRLCLPFAKKLFVTFPDTQENVKHTPVSFPGMIVRLELFDPSEQRVMLPNDRPVLLVMGGSQGANAVSECLSLGKRMVCIPIPAEHSRNEQEQNAEFAVKNGNAVLLLQKNLTAGNLLASILSVLRQEKRSDYAAEKSEMIERIARHAEEVWREAWRQFIKDLMMQAQGRVRVNPPELSAYETVVFAEVMESCGKGE